MPVLANPKHVAFAKAVADGLKMVDAYEMAGYARSPSAASQLNTRPEIQQRVSELISEKQSRADSLDDDLDNLPNELNREWLLKTLMKNVTIAQRAGQIAPANKAVEMLAELIGYSFKKPANNPTAEDEEAKEKEKTQANSLDMDRLSDGLAKIGAIMSDKESSE